MSSKSPDKPTGKQPSDENVVPLRKTGPLAPKRKRGLSIGFGIVDGDFVWQNPDGSIERYKLTDDDDDCP